MSVAHVILLLTAPGCRYCLDAEQVLAQLATAFEFHLETLSTEDERGRLLALEHGVLFPPGIFLDGELVQYGRPSAGRVRSRLAAACVPRRPVVA